MEKEILRQKAAGVFRGKERKIALMFFIAALAVLMSGCKLAEQRRALKRQEPKAVAWYKEKYGLSSAKIERAGYLSYGEWFGLATTENMYFQMKDGYTVVYLAEEERFGDDRQAGEIEKKLYENVLNPLLEETKERLHAEAAGCVDELIFNVWDGNTKAWQVYTSYFEGDIEDYMEEETIYIGRPGGVGFYVVGGPEGNYRQELKKLGESLQEQFTMSSQVTLSGISQEYYNSWKAGDRSYFSFVDDGCYLQYKINGTIACYEANYIKLMPGVYATAAEPDFMLEEGDIVCREAMTEEELQSLIDENYNKLPDYAEENNDRGYNTRDKAHESKKVIDAWSAIVRLEFSDRVKQAFRQGKIRCNVRLVIEEIEKPGGANEAASPVTDSAVQAKPDEEDWAGAFYYYPGDKEEYFCYTICSEEDVERGITLTEENYYFLGRAWSVSLEDIMEAGKKMVFAENEKILNSP